MLCTLVAARPANVCFRAPLLPHLQGLKLTGNKQELVARIQLHLGIAP